MDTREKIGESDAVKDRDAIYVAGYFDPLLASHASRLRELAAQGKPVIVLIDDPPDPLLDSRSRAELVAGLDCVEAVALMPSEPFPVTIDERPADLERRRLLLSHVHGRHRQQ